MSTEKTTESFSLSPASSERIEKLIPRYPEKRSASLPLLHIIQEEQGYISKPAVEWVAAKLGLEPINVYELVTFYPMLREKPIGKRHVKVCRTLSCALNGGYSTCDTFQKELNCGLGETSEDGEFTVEFVECIASCGTAPVVQIDEEMYEGVDVETAKSLCKQLKKGDI